MCHFIIGPDDGCQKQKSIAVFDHCVIWSNDLTWHWSQYRPIECENVQYSNDLLYRIICESWDMTHVIYITVLYYKVQTHTLDLSFFYEETCRNIYSILKYSWIKWRQPKSNPLIWVKCTFIQITALLIILMVSTDNYFKMLKTNVSISNHSFVA